jgi:hypothetical protein
VYVEQPGGEAGLAVRERLAAQVVAQAVEPFEEAERGEEQAADEGTEQLDERDGTAYDEDRGEAQEEPSGEQEKGEVDHGV